VGGKGAVELTGADLEAEFRRPPAVCVTALANVRRALGKLADQRVNGGAKLSRSGRPSEPVQIQYESAVIVAVSAGQRKASVGLAPRVDVGLEVKLGFLRNPVARAERRDELGGAGDELAGVRDAMPAFVVIPPPVHVHNLQRRRFLQAAGEEPPLGVGWGELERSEVRSSRFVSAAKPAQEVGARRVQ
jgi:hypothetical protein